VTHCADRSFRRTRARSWSQAKRPASSIHSLPGARYGGSLLGTFEAGRQPELALDHDVILLEAESSLGVHSRGRSAALFMTGYGPAPVRELTRRSEAEFARLSALPDMPALLAPARRLADRVGRAGRRRAGGHDRGSTGDDGPDRRASLGAVPRAANRRRAAVRVRPQHPRHRRARAPHLLRGNPSRSPRCSRSSSAMPAAAPAKARARQRSPTNCARWWRMFSTNSTAAQPLVTTGTAVDSPAGRAES